MSITGDRARVALAAICCAFAFSCLAGAKTAYAEDAKALGQSRDACAKWCEQHKPCKCSTVRGCGKGGQAIRSWKGKGDKWYACRYESDIQAWNKADCEAYCARNKKECLACKDKEGCGPGYASFKTFRFGNRTHLDYYACKKK